MHTLAWASTARAVCYGIVLVGAHEWPVFAAVSGGGDKCPVMPPSGPIAAKQKDNIIVTPSERTRRARLAAHQLHAQHDSRELTAPARAAFLARFEQQVDPDGVLPVAERQRRAEHAKKAHFTRLALKSAQARRVGSRPAK